MTATYKVLVVHGQQRVGRVEELGMEYDLDPVVVVVEELAPSQCIQYGVGGVFRDIVSADWWQIGPLQAVSIQHSLYSLKHRQTIPNLALFTA